MNEAASTTGSGSAAAPTPEEPLPNLSHPKTIGKVIELALAEDLRGKKVLDLGAGKGAFCRRLTEAAAATRLDLSNVLVACDLYAKEIRTKNVQRMSADFSHPLPFRDGAFDTVVCVEVIEHVPNQIEFIAEVFRVLKPGGRAIFSTPNILNANGRIRFLTTGTWPLFDIMPYTDRTVVNVSGHIGPISLYYLFFFAKVAGFGRCNWYIDRTKRSAALIAPWIWLGYQLLRPIYTRRQKRQPWFAENKDAVAEMNRWQTLVGRTIILEAFKP